MDKLREILQDKGPDEILSLGPVSFVDLTEVAESGIKFLIHNGEVVVCLSLTDIHESVIGIFSSDFIIACSTVDISSWNLVPIGNLDYPVCNDIGCHSITKKQPDYSVRPRARIAREGGLGPTLVLEVAVKNEPFWFLMVEGRAWVQAAGVEYVVLMKVFPPPSPRRIRILILKRTEYPIPPTLNLAGLEPPTCMMAPRDVENMTTSELESLFGLRIVFDLDCQRRPPPGLEYSFAFERSRIMRDPSLGGYIRVPLNSLINYVFDADDDEYRIRPI